MIRVLDDIRIIYIKLPNNKAFICSNEVEIMRIAMIGHKRIPSREGGVEIVVEELSTRMVALGHDVTAYNRGGHHVAGKENDIPTQKCVKRKEYKGVRLITVPTYSKKSLNAIVYATLATLHAIVGRYDVIHYHAEGCCALLRLPHMFGIHTIATIHGLDWQRSKWGGFATRFLLYGEKKAAKYADEIIVLSRNVQNYFEETYQRETQYIPNGITIPKIRPANRITKAYGLQANHYILFLARIVPEKGLHYLLDAYKQIDTDMPLVIAGGSSHTEDYMKEITKKAAEDSRVIMTGFIQGERLEELYSNCYLYVLPSDIEGMPISLLEAMSYGRRCLCSDIPENQETAGKLSEYFRKSDVEDLREKLENIVSQEKAMRTCDKDDADNKSIKQKQEYVAQYYNWDDVVEKTLALYCK